VVSKPSGMHCAPASEPGTLCSWLFSLMPEAAAVHGWRPDEGGMAHRLDSSTSGLVVFALDDVTFAAMAAAADAGGFVKSYRALGTPSIAGLPGSRPVLTAPDHIDEPSWLLAVRHGDTGRLASMAAGASITSVFRPYGPGATRVACSRDTRAPGTQAQKGKSWTKAPYRTELKGAVQRADSILFDVELSRGFRHQIRAHLAWMGLPLIGDSLYGDEDGILRLRAYRISIAYRPGTAPLVIDLDAC